MDACLICARLFAGRLRFSSSSHALNIEQDLCCRRLRRNGVSLQISCRKEALPIRSFDNKPWREIKKITPIKNLRAYSRFSQYFTYNEGEEADADITEHLDVERAKYCLCLRCSGCH